MSLKQLILDDFRNEFEELEILLKRTPNLKIFSIFGRDKIELFDGNRWQYLIETSLPHLHTFKFNFHYGCRYDCSKKLTMVQPFQTDFWCKLHHWYTNFEIDDFSVLIYTIPYVWNEYVLTSTMTKYSNALISNLNEFDNVKELYLWTNVIRNNSSCYF